MIKAYSEIIDFIAAGTTPASVAGFVASVDTKRRVNDLIQLEKNGTINAEEKSELEHYLEIEHIMRLAKARARSIASR